MENERDLGQLIFLRYLAYISNEKVSPIMKPKKRASRKAPTIQEETRANSFDKSFETSPG